MMVFDQEIIILPNQHSVWWQLFKSPDKDTFDLILQAVFAASKNEINIKKLLLSTTRRWTANQIQHN